MEQDISNKTIVVLVILTVIISILSAFVIISEVNNANVVVTGKAPSMGQSGGSAKGQVSLIINDEPAVSKATGQVTLTIV